MIDPTIVPATVRERITLEAIRKAGLHLHRCRADGPAVRLTGYGVWVTAAKLGYLSPQDLEPVPGPRRR